MKNKSFKSCLVSLFIFFSCSNTMANIAKPSKTSNIKNVHVLKTKETLLETQSKTKIGIISMKNPLLNLSFNQFPDFLKVEAEHIEPAIDYLLEKNRAKIQTLLVNTKEYTWENLVLPLEKIEAELGDAWSIVTHLNGVKNEPEFYKAYEKALVKMTTYGTEVRQNKSLYRAYKILKESDRFQLLTNAQKKTIENPLLEFKLSGIELSLENQELFKKLTTQLSEFESRFEQNVLQSTKGWFLNVTDLEKLKGLSPEFLASSALKAKEKGKSGWLLTIDQPSYHAVMTMADDRSIRKKLYEAYVTKASGHFPGGSDWDNSQLVLDIIKIRKQLANLLGFKDYCEYALQNRMVKKTENVVEFLSDLLVRAKISAKKELKALQDFAKKEYQLEKIELWDLPYLSEKLLHQKYSISEEVLRPYFPEEKVLKGLFTIAENLYHIKIQEVKSEINAWDSDVRFFEVYDQNNVLRGKFFIDLYTRSSKQGGAWVGPAKSRLKHEEKLQYPVAYLNTNVSKSASENGQPTLLSHDEVVTLFHEFGHCLHHILTMVDYPSVGSFHVEWDAVELPSQLMENWAWEKEVLMNLISQHWETKKPLPLEMITKLKEAKNFNNGLFLVRQLEFALFDFNLHAAQNLDKPEDVQKILNKVREETALLEIPDYNRFQNGFTHIFAGGYSAGYYSYLWAEMLSSDTYEFFKERGLLFDDEIAHKFLTQILEPGASQDFMDLFVAFRGKKPQVGALLRHYGLEDN